MEGHEGGSAPLSEEAMARIRKIQEDGAAQLADERNSGGAEQNGILTRMHEQIEAIKAEEQKEEGEIEEEPGTIA